MKNKKVTALAMMMTMCMLGNSAVGAAEFSSGPSSVTDASESDSVENSNVTDADQPVYLQIVPMRKFLMHRRMQSLSLMQSYWMSFLLMRRQMKFRKHKTREVLTVPLLPGTKMLW